MKSSEAFSGIYATGLSGTIGRHLSAQIRPLELDLAKPIEKNMIPEDLSTLIHLAGIVGEKIVLDDIEYAYQVNVVATLELAKSLNLENLDRFLYVSTSHVYAPKVTDIAEEDPVGPIAEYPKQKLEAEESLKKVFSEYPEKLLIIRVFSVFGDDVADFTLGGLASRIAAGSSELIMNCDDIRDFLTPEQIAIGIEKVAKIKNISGIFNLCTGKPLSVSNVMRKYFNRINYPAEKYESQFRSGQSQTPRIVGSNSKLLKAVPELGNILSI